MRLLLPEIQIWQQSDWTKFIKGNFLLLSQIFGISGGNRYTLD
jgi:hypothetical protein